MIFRRLSPHLKLNYELNTIRHLFGANTFIAGIFSFFLLTALGWWINSSHHFFIEYYFKGNSESLPQVGYSLLAVIVSVMIPWILAHLFRARVRPTGTTTGAIPAKVRILFLSPNFPPRDGRECPVKKQLTERTKHLDDLSFLGTHPWRIALEGIRSHEESLEKIIVISSADREGIEGETVQGTYHEFPTFRTLTESLYLNQPGPEIIPLGVATNIDRYRQGVDFENAEELVESIDAVFETLSKQGYSDDEIITDVTGGQKPTSAIAAVMALAEGRRFQYVSTHDYQVKTFNLTYHSHP